MGGAVVQDRFSRGMGSAARAIGVPYDLYRADGVSNPLASGRIVLRLCAAFDGGDPGYRRPRGYERALRGVFDADCTRVGDYLVGALGVLFVAAVPALRSPLCVRTNAVVDVLRAAGPGAVGLNGYGGVREERLRTVLAGWPAEVLAGAPGRGRLPADGGQGDWSVLLPPTPVPVLGSDLVHDAEGRRYLVRSAEHTSMGWRLQVREVGV